MIQFLDAFETCFINRSGYYFAEIPDSVSNTSSQVMNTFQPSKVRTVQLFGIAISLIVLDSARSALKSVRSMQYNTDRVGQPSAIPVLNYK